MDCTFTGNRADYAVGGLLWESEPSSGQLALYLDIHNCLFADHEGVAIAIDDAIGGGAGAEILSTTVAGNRGGGIRIDRGTAILRDTISYGNTDGPDLWVADNAMGVTVTSSGCSTSPLTTYSTKACMTLKGLIPPRRRPYALS